MDRNYGPSEIDEDYYNLMERDIDYSIEREVDYLMERDVRIIRGVLAKYDRLILHGPINKTKNFTLINELVARGDWRVLFLVQNCRTVKLYKDINPKITVVNYTHVVNPEGYDLVIVNDLLTPIPELQRLPGKVLFLSPKIINIPNCNVFSIVDWHLNSFQVREVIEEEAYMGFLNVLLANPAPETITRLPIADILRLIGEKYKVVLLTHKFLPELNVQQILSVEGLPLVECDILIDTGIRYSYPYDPLKISPGNLFQASGETTVNPKTYVSRDEINLIRQTLAQNKGQLYIRQHSGLHPGLKPSNEIVRTGFTLPEKLYQLLEKSLAKLPPYPTVILTGLITYGNKIYFGRGKHNDDLDRMLEFWTQLNSKRTQWSDFKEFSKQNRISELVVKGLIWGLDQIAKLVTEKIQLSQIPIQEITPEQVKIFRGLVEQIFADVIIIRIGNNFYHHDSQVSTVSYYSGSKILGIKFEQNQLLFGMIYNGKSFDDPHTYMNKESERYPFTRILNHGHTYHEAYKRSDDKTTVHWGQRKLHLSEVEFLTYYIRQQNQIKRLDDSAAQEVYEPNPSEAFPKTVVIYAGAAHGNHISLLSRLFPHVEFYLVDPGEFRLEESDKITIVNKYFTDALAVELRQKYFGYKILFISDIRTVDESKIVKETERHVAMNMEMQKRWYYILDPELTLLKFRLPYSGVQGADFKKTTSYLDGEIYYQVWAPQSSSETRLMVKRGASVKDYDNKRYEDECYYFNHYIRPSHFDSPNLNIDYFDHCNDCVSEAVIHANYLAVKALALSWKATKDDLPIYNNEYPSRLAKQVRALVEELTKHLGPRQVSEHYKRNFHNFEFTEVIKELRKIK